jgi:uncharacterized repeat protein (TIGR01451 family)
MKRRTLSKATIVLIALSMAVPLVQASSPQAPPFDQAQKAALPIAPESPSPFVAAKEPVDDGQPPTVSQEEALRKLHPDLRKLAQDASPALPVDVGVQAAADQESIPVEVFAEVGTDLSEYFVDGKFFGRPPIGKGEEKVQVFIGFVKPTVLLKIASLTKVKALLPIVLEKNAQPDNYPIDDPVAPPEPEDWATLRAESEALSDSMPDWDEAKAIGDGRTVVRPMDWFEVMPEGPHKAEAAWDRGYRGEGVTVAVLDDGIDPAHPDLMGTQRIYSSTVKPEYNGWPVVFSPWSQLLYATDEFLGSSFIADGYFAVHYVDTSETPALSACGSGLSCFDFTPLIAVGEAGTEHTYIISDTMTSSGVVHAGTHPDNDLRDFLWGEKPAIIATDPNTAGVYDTVYMDLDNDYDFRDEKPLTRADVGNLGSTRNDMIAYRDVDGDGLADISGGMVYFIGDGSHVIPASDYMWGAACPGPMCPGNGDLVAISGSTFDRAYSHGTQCASNVVGQGVTQSVDDAMLPEFTDLPGDGKAAGAVFGMAPDAKVVNVSDIYYNHESSTIDAWLFAAVGYDACDQTGFDMITAGACTDTDAIQVTSNSYGASDTDNDGWEYRGQVMSQVQRWYGPNLQHMVSTGNGAPAYGTAAPPSPATGINVGASTQFGSTGWDSITYTTQIMNNDVTPFSNRGPGARGTNGVDVVAGGAFAAGAEELNYYSISTWGAPDGNLSWVSWGGTSRSAPVAAGVMALIYEAYEDAAGSWPTYDVAEALLKSSSTDLNYDTLTQGAGSVNADRGTAVASGEYGLFTMPAEWNPGDYRGDDYPAFAHVAYPGDTFTETFSVYNPGAEPITAGVQDTEMKLIRSEAFSFTVTSAMAAAESAYGADNQDNFYKAFHYFIPITATASADSAWHNIDVPADADLMIVRQMFPYDEFDANGDYEWDNRFYLMVYNWMDVNENGIVWDDKDGNQVVNFINSGVVSQIDGGEELDWDDPRTELDRWEYGRFSYHRPGGNRNEMWVHDPLERMHDGLFIGLRHHPGSTFAGDAHLQYRIDFYKQEDVSWLSLDDTEVTVPAGGSATFTGQVQVPNDMAPGMYQAGIEIHDPGEVPTYTVDTSVVPVVLSVAAPFTDGLELGGYGTYGDAYNTGRPYNNAAVRGLFDWTWRAESGDWRFFYTDVDETEFPAGAEVLIKDEWDDVAPHTDIDTILLGPTSSSLGSSWYDFPEPSFYGPYVLDTIVKSENTNVSAGTWLFNTTSGANEDWLHTPLEDGLHELLQHNVLFEGDEFDVVFTKTLGSLMESPASFEIDTYVDQGTVGDLVVTPTLPLNGLEASAYLEKVDTDTWTNEPINFVDSDTIEWTNVFTVENGVSIELSTSSPDISDIDLFLFYLGPTGAGPAEQRGASETGGANEHIFLSDPEDGYWVVGINNWSGPAGHFNLTRVVTSRGPGLSVSGLPSGAVAADTAVTLKIDYDRQMEPGMSYDGVVTLGPPEAPQLKSVPVTINKIAALEKAVDKDVAFPGDELHYDITLENAFDPEMVRMVDPIPEYTEFVSASDNVTYDNIEEAIVFHDTLTDTEGITLTVRVLDTAMPGTWITNTATMTATSLFEDERSSSAYTKIGAADFQTSYKVAPAEVVGGNLIDYTIHISNTGEAVSEVSLVDPIPTNTTFDSGDMELTYNATADQVEWTNDVAAGGEVSLSFSVLVDAAAFGTTITNTAQLTVDGVSIPLVATTDVLPPYRLFMPVIMRNAAP